METKRIICTYAAAFTSRKGPLETKIHYALGCQVKSTLPVGESTASSSPHPNDQSDIAHKNHSDAAGSSNTQRRFRPHVLLVLKFSWQSQSELTTPNAIPPESQRTSLH